LLSLPLHDALPISANTFLQIWTTRRSWLHRRRTRILRPRDRRIPSAQIRWPLARPVSESIGTTWGRARGGKARRTLCLLEKLLGHGLGDLFWGTVIAWHKLYELGMGNHALQNGIGRVTCRQGQPLTFRLSRGWVHGVWG